MAVKFSHRSDQGTVGETPIENARYGPEKKLYEASLKPRLLALWASLFLSVFTHQGQQL